jgi:hypothetical protein
MRIYYTCRGILSVWLIQVPVIVPIFYRDASHASFKISIKSAKFMLVELHYLVDLLLVFKKGTHLLQYRHWSGFGIFLIAADYSSLRSEYTLDQILDEFHLVGQWIIRVLLGIYNSRSWFSNCSVVQTQRVFYLDKLSEWFSFSAFVWWRKFSSSKSDNVPSVSL